MLARDAKASNAVWQKFSGNPSLLQETKRNFNFMLYKMECPFS